jgi:hypothetical protein
VSSYYYAGYYAGPADRNSQGPGTPSIPGTPRRPARTLGDLNAHGGSGSPRAWSACRAGSFSTGSRRNTRMRCFTAAVKARVAIEQASTLGWDRYVGDGGAVIGMHRRAVAGRDRHLRPGSARQLRSHSASRCANRRGTRRSPGRRPGLPSWYERLSVGRRVGRAGRRAGRRGTRGRRDRRRGCARYAATRRHPPPVRA